MSIVNIQLGEYRKKLLDLTLRNRLLNHHPTKSRTVTIQGPPCQEVYDILVVNKEKTVILSRPLEENQHITILPDQNVELSEKISKQNDIKNLKRKTLTTLYEREDLEKRLTKLFRESKTVFEERGYTVLYLALGFLRWNDPDHPLNSYKAPLILIPVDLTRRGSRGSFQLSWNEEDIFTNLSLREKLREFDVDLPDFEMQENSGIVGTYYDTIRESIRNYPQWSLTEEIFLDFFSFSKFIMFKDLNPESWSVGRIPSEHPLISTLLDPSKGRDISQGFIESDVDRIPLKKTYHILDADSSQIAVIEDAKNGKNLVVEGPPGTGKSQTIANIIAELLGQQKSVLFVSEKMAALQVVKNRLDVVGLGDFCLELHSRKAKKREVLDALKTAVYDTYEPNEPDEGILSQLEKSRAELNDYVSQLHKEIDVFQKTPYWIFGRRELIRQHFDKVGRKQPIIPIDNSNLITFERYHSITKDLENYELLLKLFYPLKESPFFGCFPDELLPHQIEQVIEISSQLIQSVSQLEDEIKIFTEKYGVRQPKSISEIQKIQSTIQIIGTPYKTTKSAVFHSCLNNRDATISPIITSLEHFQRLKKEIDVSFNSAILDLNTEICVSRITQLCNEYQTNSPIYKKFREDISKFYINFATVSDEEILQDAKHVNFVIKLFHPQIFQINVHDLIIKYQEIVKTCEGSKWQYQEYKTKINEIYKDKNSISDEEIIRNLNFASSVISTFKKEFLQFDVEKIRQNFQKLCEHSLPYLDRNYRKYKRKIREYYKISPPSDNRSILEDLQNAVEFRNIFILDSFWAEPYSIATEFIDISQKFRKNASELQELSKYIEHFYRSNTQIDRAQITKTLKIVDSVAQRFNTNIFNGDFDGLVAEYQGIRERYWDVINRYNGIIEKIVPYYNNEDGRKVQEIISDLEKVNLAKKEKSFLLSQNEFGKEFFGDLWKGELSEISSLKSYTDWIDALNVKYSDGSLTDLTIERIINGIPYKEYNLLFEDIQILSSDVIRDVNVISEALKPDYQKIFNSPWEEITLECLRKWSENIHKNSNTLFSWSQFLQQNEQFSTHLLQPFIEAIYSDKIFPEDISWAFEGNYLDSLMPGIFKERSEVRTFIGDIHENLINEFNILDKKMIELNKKRLISRLKKNIPKFHNSSLSSYQEKILINEFQKKKRHLPIRQLMKKTGALIQQIKPCFMMSPLSTAQFLDPEAVEFDIIIFDEASQVRPEDALGALMRGKQAIIMGDSKQLPPTTFFDQIIELSDEKEESDDEFYSTDIESILQLSKNRFPMKLLKWHYRSRHESLIAVSNREFYENKLLVYPSPFKNKEDLGLKLEYLPSTSYDRGRSKTNRREAKVVANYILTHFRNYPTKSLMVGTFSVPQQQAIWDELDNLMKSNPDLGHFIESESREHFDVKNLETIQGDERDVVLVSVGYGFDDNHNFPKFFGPLNHDGGERRLNVLMTRAREKCVLFSNFNSSHLGLTEATSRGVKALKQFLAYAETGEFPTTTSIGDPESPFEEAVFQFLSDNGYSVVTQVGCAGFRIDLAVSHPNFPGRYIAGIECDGAQYHSSKVARDRDRLRQQILEGLGWTIIRVWSTDWYRNNQKCKDVLLNSIKTILSTMVIPSVQSDRAEKKEVVSVPIREQDTPRIKDHANNTCPFDTGLELINFLEKEKWQNLSEWKALLLHSRDNAIINTVYEIWKRDADNLKRKDNFWKEEEEKFREMREKAQKQQREQDSFRGIMD